MRYVPDMADQGDIEDVQRLNAEEWQLECLKYNPAYVSWGVHEDYMTGRTDRDGKQTTGWDQPHARPICKGERDSSQIDGMGSVPRA